MSGSRHCSPAGVRLVSCVLLAGFLLAPVVARADPRADPEVTNVRVAIDDGYARLSFQLDGAFDEPVLERISTGLPTGFRYQFRLDRDRKRWFDASLARSMLEVSAMYNAVTEEYLVNFKLDGKLIESRVVRDLEALERAMTRIASVPVFELAGLDGSDRMLVRVRADLGSKTGFLFLPTREETGWTRSRKFRPDDEAG